MADNFLFQFGNTEYDLAARPYIMGVLNVTPDSFSDGGMYFSIESAFRHAATMIEQGADFIDIGGESTRPGAETVTPEEETRRTIPVIEALAKEFPGVPISIDTYKSQIAARALDAGATIVNDISGGRFDPEMFALCGKRSTSMVLMHIQGTPKTMQQNPYYDNVVKEIKDFLRTQSEQAKRAGVKQIILDVGIGFGKTLEHNLELLRRHAEFEELGHPLLIGVSRKSFIGKILHGAPVEQRLFGTAAATAIAVANGACIVRAHDVKEMREVSAVAFAIARS
ncbi:MAG TPA: dihydropteroate synthase [Candidatus Kapabacteria bacterium]|nr:dihydropteroate synthase [Candidatus Kapabacteria bacterium]